MNIEIFIASGGLAAGFRAAGIEFDLAIDRDPDACASYEANIGVRPEQLDVHDLLEKVRGGWRPGPVDLFVADPPCAPWSRAGKRQGLADERDTLAETVELVRLLRPRAYLIGNIPGLQDAPHWPVVQRTIGSLSREGYCVADFAVLDAADYGVPQRRVRPYWFGHLAGPCIQWPAPTHGASAGGGTLPGLGLKPWVTCRQALQHLPPAELGRPVRMKLRPAKGAAHPGDLKYGSDVGRCSTPDNVASTLTTKDTAKGGQILITSAVGPNGGDASMCSTPDRPAATVVAHQTAKGGQILVTEPRDRHPTNTLDAPARAIKADGGRPGSRESVLSIPEAHRGNRLNEPSQTMGAKVRNVGPQLLELDADQPQARTRDDRAPRTPQSARVAAPDAPAPTLDTREPRSGSGNATLEWPWDRPATTVYADDRMAPPGRRPASGIPSIMSDPNAIVLSERAAAILQGFPDGWTFCGKTKRARWSQLGQAVPPAVAEAIGRAVREQMQRAETEAV